MDQPIATIFYEEWQKYQDSLKSALAPLTAEQLNLRAAPHLRSVGEITRHIIAARANWFGRFLGEGDEAIKSYSLWDEPDEPERPAGELLSGLDVTWELMAEVLARWTPADLQKTFPRRWRGSDYELSRSWVVWHVLEHDLHHGGEVSLTLGVHGLQSPDI
ncbi:MAG: DinB family protein [Chloroflexi bacterium]|nr:DinB family protein [Chloroflexota bacterium]MCI0644638.1 DinB family protein [Chloroflexota bacterium]MCI0730449.1 DinB family protein [Chloroflexota bacterium]